MCKNTKIGGGNHILGQSNVQIEILCISDILNWKLAAVCRKIATSCPQPTFSTRAAMLRCAGTAVRLLCASVAGTVLLITVLNECNRQYLISASRCPDHCACSVRPAPDTRARGFVYTETMKNRTRVSADDKNKQKTIDKRIRKVF